MRIKSKMIHNRIRVNYKICDSLGIPAEWVDLVDIFRHHLSMSSPDRVFWAIQSQEYTTQMWEYIAWVLTSDRYKEGLRRVTEFHGPRLKYNYLVHNPTYGQIQNHLQDLEFITENEAYRRYIIEESKKDCCDSFIKFKATSENIQPRESNVSLENKGFFERLFEYFSKN